MPNLSSTEQTENTKDLVLNRLKAKKTPMSLHDLEANLKSDLVLSHRTIKEAAWKLVEEGKVQFTPNWSLELKSF